MSLSFLAPLFLAGLAALAIPVILHLRRRSQRREIEFPSLMFLQDIPFRSRRRRTLRNKLLLALRLLALALLVAAFARPFLDDEATAAAGDLGPRELVVLVDRSWSMGYGERWQEAVDAVRDATAGLGPQDRVSVVLFDETATAPLRSSPDRERAARIVAEASPTDRATTAAPAIRLARSLLEASRLPRREVVMVSDFQASGWTGVEDVALPTGTGFTPAAVGQDEEDWSNVTVRSVELQRASAGERDAIRPVAQVVRRGAQAPTSTVAVLEVEGEVRERVDVSLAEESAEVSFGPVPLTPDPLRAEIRLSGDALPRDDVHRIVLSPGERIAALVLEPPGARPNASLYLARALEISRDPPIAVEVLGGGGVPSDLADRFDVLVLNDRPAPTGAEAATVRSFLERGGGVLWAPGEAAPSTDTPGFFGVDPGDVRDHDRGEEVRLAGLDRRHPVFEPFRESGTGNFSTARFFRSRGLAPDDSAAVIARFGDGAPALVEATLGPGRVLVWGSTLHTFWTDLPIQPVFLPFVQRAVVHLANRDRMVPFYRVGDILPLIPGGEESAGAVVPDPGGEWTAVLTPGGDRIERSALEGPLLLDRAGFYELVTDDAELGTPIAVNVDPREGDLTRRDLEEVTALVRPAAESGAGAEDGAEAVSATVRPEDQERYQGFWRFLLAAAFVLLVGETMLSNRLKPERARP